MRFIRKLVLLSRLDFQDGRNESPIPAKLFTITIMNVDHQDFKLRRTQVKI